MSTHAAIYAIIVTLLTSFNFTTVKTVITSTAMPVASKVFCKTFSATTTIPAIFITKAI